MNREFNKLVYTNKKYNFKIYWLSPAQNSVHSFEKININNNIHKQINGKYKNNINICDMPKNLTGKNYVNQPFIESYNESVKHTIKKFGGFYNKIPVIRSKIRQLSNNKIEDIDIGKKSELDCINESSIDSIYTKDKLLSLHLNKIEPRSKLNRCVKSSKYIVMPKNVQEKLKNQYYYEKNCRKLSNFEEPETNEIIENKLKKSEDIVYIHSPFIDDDTAYHRLLFNQKINNLYISRRN